MKRILNLFIAITICFNLGACGANSADTDTKENANIPTNNTDTNINNTGNEVNTNQNVAISIAPSKDVTTINITGAFAEYFAQKTDNNEIHFVVQLENENGGFADLRLDANHAWFFYYSEDGEENIKGAFTENSVTFSYPTNLFELEDLTSMSVYIAEGDGSPEQYESIPISDVSIASEVLQAMSTDEHGIVGIYMDVFSDSSNILEISTDAFGYVAKLNGTDYALATNEQDSGDYIAYIGTSELGERFCLNVLDNKTMSISEYYGEPEMRYTLEYAPLYDIEFYGYDKELNPIENPVKYEFDGTNMQITIDDTYTTGWVSLEEMKNISGSLGFLQLYDYPITSLEDGEVYFLNLKAFPKKDDFWKEMSIQLFSVYESYIVEGEYYPSSIVMTDMFIADVETDNQTKAKMNDMIGTYVGEQSFYGESSVSHKFEIRENEILLDDKSLANINMEKLYATLLVGHSMIIYEGDEPTDVLSIGLNGEYLSVRMQEYGTTFNIAGPVSPDNYQLPTLDVALEKQ